MGHEKMKKILNGRIWSSYKDIVLLGAFRRNLSAVVSGFPDFPDLEQLDSGIGAEDTQPNECKELKEIENNSRIPVDLIR